MKKITVFLISALFLTTAVTAFAEEELGFIQRLKNRFMKKPAQAVTASKAVSMPKAAASSVTEKAGPIDMVPAPKTEGIPVNREDFIDSIKQTLDADPEVIPNIADLKMVKDGDKVSYTFKEFSLESLDDESLQGLANKIIGEVGRVRSVVVSEQMAAIRQAQQVQQQLSQVQQAQNASRQSAQIQSISKPPSGPAAGGPGGPGGPGSARGPGGAGGPGGPGGPGSGGGRR